MSEQAICALALQMLKFCSGIVKRHEGATVQGFVGIGG